MRILLVIPSQYCMAHGGHDRTKIKVGRTANLSIIQIAGLIPAEHDVEIVDDHFEEPDYRGDYDWVGITAMTPQAPRAYEIADQFRARGIPVVLGGFHATLATEDAENHADAVVVGEAEQVMPQLLEDIRSGTLKKRYQAEGFINLGQLPLPRYDLLAKKGYRYVAWPVQVTRGCPLICHFCSITAFYKRTYRKRPIEDVVACVKTIPSNSIFFVDDDFFVAGRSYLLPLFEALKPLGISWYSQTDIKSVDNDEVLAAARQSGCRALFVGIESFFEDSLEAIKKERTNKRGDYKRVIDKIHRHRISVTASYIVGLDHDRPERHAEILDFFEKNKVEEIVSAMVIPLPGTPITTDLERDGRIIDRDFNHYDGTHELISHPNFKLGEMAAVYWDTQKRFYSLGSIFKRLFPFRRGSMRDQLAILLFNLFVLRYWVKRNVSPYVANGFPPWMGRALWIRAVLNEKVLRRRGEAPLVGLDGIFLRRVRQAE